MSYSASTSNRVFHVERQIRYLTKELEIIQDLPPQLAVRSVLVGSESLKAYSMVLLEGDWEQSLELMPPLALKVARSNSRLRGKFEPTETPLMCNGFPVVHPVFIYASEVGDIRWFSKTNSGLIVQVAFKTSNSKKAPPFPAGYSATDIDGYWVGILDRKSQSEFKTSPADTFKAAWECFYAELGLNEAQKRLARVFAGCSSRGEVLAVTDLPGGSLVRQPKAIVPNSKLAGLPRVDDFWTHFTEAQAAALIEFSISQVQNPSLEDQIQAFVKNAFDEAKVALAAFEAKWLQTSIIESVSSNRNACSDALTYWVQMQTKHGIRCVASAPLVFQAGVPNGRLPLAVSLSYLGWHESASMTYPEVIDPVAGFDWNFAPFYDYKTPM